VAFIFTQSPGCGFATIYLVAHSNLGNKDELHSPCSGTDRGSIPLTNWYLHDLTVIYPHCQG